MIKPTVGRVVWFHCYVENQEMPALAAIISWVQRDDLVNLGVFKQSGGVYGVVDVELYQGEGPRPMREFCEWMPYQLGQAAKELHPVIERTFP
jgi:hypothetical protein